MGGEYRATRDGIRGLVAVDLTVRDLEPTARVLEEVFGFRRRYEHRESGARVSIFEVGPGGPGTEAPAAHLGRGCVHHVAFRTPDDEEQAAWRERVRAAGLGVMRQIDRYYLSPNLLPRAWRGAL